jgi:hypothetical protein
MAAVTGVANVIARRADSIDGRVELPEIDVITTAELASNLA